MTSPDTVFPVTRLTLGLARHAERSQTPRASNTLNGPHDVLDKRKRKRPEQAHDNGWLWLCWLMTDMIMTPGNTPLPRALTIEPPLLGHRYLPVSIAGDGAFSRTIIAQDVLHPQKPMVAIKAMKPGFEAIGQQEYKLLRRIQNLPMPKYTNLPIVQAFASFSASSTYHLVLEALEPEKLCLPDCPHNPNCASAAVCPFRQSALRKVASQLLLGLSVLHDQMGYIHADMKPENILRCRSVSPSMKVKLIDLGNAVPIDRTNIYYDDFEVQSIHYRAPEVLLGLPFNSSIDIFSLGLILAELLLSPIDPPPAIIPRVPSFPTSPPQSHSPPPLHCVPLLSTFNSNRRAFVEQMTRLFGPLPSIYHNAKFWSDEYAQIDVDIPLSQRMETDGVGPALIDFIMRMVELNPAQRISAREALRHEWIVGPMLGYWAVVGVEWTQPEIRNIMWKRPENQPTLEEDHPRERSPVLGLESFPPMKRNGTVESENVSVENVQRGGSVQSTSSSPEGHVESISRKPPPLYDFSAMQDSDEEDIDEVSQVLYSGSSPTKPLLYIEHKPPPPLEIEEPEMDDDEVLLL